MGMDVYGKAPASEVGDYFRNNVWYWRPLWGYCCERFPELVGPTPELGHSNDAYGLDADGAAALGRALLNDVETGVTEEYRVAYNAEVAALPRSTCEFCEGTGIRTDAVGQEMGMPDRELDAAAAVVLGRSTGWCNACGGYGECLHPACDYPFVVDNVREFGEFLVACGGFEIC